MPKTKEKGYPIPPVEEKKKVSMVGMGRKMTLSFYTRLVLLSSSFYKKVLFDPFPLLGVLATHALFITRGVTHFFLFTRAGVYGFLLLTVCVMVGNVEYTRKFLSALYLLDPHILFSRFELFLDPFFLSLLSFDFFILSLVLTNTTFLHIPQVKETIIGVYGEKLLADRGYNPPFQSLRRVWNMNGTLWASFAGGFTATTLYHSYEESYLYGKWYHLYTEAQLANGDVPFLLPCTTKGFVEGLLSTTLHHFS